MMNNYTRRLKILASAVGLICIVVVLLWGIDFNDFAD